MYLNTEIDMENNLSLPIRLKGDKMAANFLGCHYQTVRKLRRDGKISYIRIGRAYFYDPRELYQLFHHNIKS